MTITREQVADLQPGDVVEYAGHRDLRGAKIVGPVYISPTGHLCVGDYVVRTGDGRPSAYRQADLTLTVVSRAPRPLYVNHSRTAPALGDVVKDGNGEVRHALPPKMSVRGAELYGVNEIRWWAAVAEYDGEWLHCSTDFMPKPLTLLVDGETGQVVP